MAGTFGLAQPDAILSLLSQQAVSVTGNTSASGTACLELEEIQEADLDRSKTRVKYDLTTVAGRQAVNAVQVDTVGDTPSTNTSLESFIVPAICYVDLFRVPDAYGPQNAFESRMLQTRNHGPPPGVVGADIRSTFHPGQNENALPSFYDGAWPINSTPALPDSDVIAWSGSFPIHESSKCTDMLSGTTFTQAERGEHCGRPATMFIFSDLAVHSEGTFVLRYRVAEMGVHYSQPRLFSAVAECFGQPFKVLSAGEYSGRRASESTPVAQHLPLHGISVKTLQPEDEAHTCESFGVDAPSAVRMVSAPKRSIRSSTTPFNTTGIFARL